MSSKYPKFDSFLKRTLENKDYKEVKLYEPCVVTSSTEKHTFRFTFLTRDQIYITENPPKSIVFSVHLKNVVAVNLVHDKATFLQSDLQDSVQHVVVKFLGENNDHFKSSTSNSSMKLLSSSTFASGTSFSYLHETESSVSRNISIPTICAYSSVAEVSKSQSGYQSQLSNDIVKERRSSAPYNILKSGLKLKKSSSKWLPKDAYSTCVLRESLEEGLDPASDVQELHLYILNKNTVFLLMLQSIWRNYIVHGCNTCKEQSYGNRERHETQHYDDTDMLSKPASVSSDDITRTLFSDLKQDLAISNSVEQVYGLFNELKTVVMQDILIKCLFWKDAVLFKLGMELSKKYILQSTSVEAHTRADEIELAVLILQTISIMLRETEAIPQCYRVLQSLSSPHLKDMIETILASPVLPNALLANKEIESLKLEYTVAAAEVIYELIVASQQITWVVSGKSPVFRTGYLYEVIGQSIHLFDFLDCLMAASIRIWDPNFANTESTTLVFKRSHSLIQSEALNPDQAIQAFHIFTVLHRLISSCSTAAHHLRDQFKEEFRYYIHPDSVPVKFPPEYSISGMARSVVHAVGSYVINGP